jgi:hypothetical protein
MDIITRNLFRLLRAGAFGTEEQVEPMSAWKWNQAYHLAMVHGVESETWAGVERLHEQFFMRLTDKQRQQWKQSAVNSRPTGGTPLPSRLAKKLNRMEDEADRLADTTFVFFRRMVVMSQSLLTADRWVRQLLSLATPLRTDALRLNREQLEEWSVELGMDRMVQLQGALLTRLMGIGEERLPFSLTLSEEQRSEMVDDIVATIAATTHQWKFSQGSNIFVHNSNSTAMYWQARHSVHYLKYHPKESINSFFSSFMQSLTNIEE